MRDSSMTTTYRPALLPGGDVSLARACRFTAFLQDVVSQTLAAPVVEAAPNDRPTTMAEVERAERRPAPGRVRMATPFDVYQAVVEGGRFAELAALIVVAVEPDGAVRDVTEEEARSEAFPAGVFTEALPLFFERSTGLTTGLLGMPHATRSASGTAPPETTTTTPNS